MAEQGTQSAPNLRPADHLMQLATGFMASACVSVAAELKIADLLAGGAKPVSELARAAQVNEDALYRVLRALASVGVFAEVTDRAFVNTPASEAMRTDVPESLRDMVRWISGPFHLRIYSEMMHSVKTGETAIEKVTGMGAFEYFESDSPLGEIFNSAMTNFSGMTVPAILEAYDFSGLGTLADIAGGHGFVLTSILRKHQDLRGILFDLSHVVSGATTRIESLGLSGRCRTVEGDFFKAVPAADSYVMKHIIHDWDDERALTILRNCARAMTGTGKVILLESVIQPGNEPHIAKWIDVEMLAIPAGRERTESEFARLFEQSGLRLSRVVPTKGPLWVVEAVRA